MNKCKGGCQMKSGGKACAKCGCDMEDEEYEKGEKGEKEMRSGGMACMKCGGKMHKSGGTVSSCMKCGGGKYTFGGKVGWSKKKVTSNSSEKYASGGMIKRADGSYSRRGLWDNIRANAGSGKEPTKQMLEQEKKIKQEMAVGGTVDTGCPDGMVKDLITGECVYPYTTSNPNDPRIKSYSDSLYSYNRGFELAGDLGKKFDNYTNNDADYENKFKDAYLNKKNNFVGTLNGPPMTRNELNKKNNEIGWANKHYDEYTKLPVNPHSTAIFSELPPIVKYKAPVQPVIYRKPDVRVPEAKYTQQDLDNAFKQRREQEDLEAWNKWYAENPLPEPEPRMNDEMEISYYKPVDMPMIKPGLIPTSEIVPNINTGIKYQKESGQGSYPTMLEEGQGMTNKKVKKKYAVGGAVDGRCPDGMMWDETKKTCVSVFVTDEYGNRRPDYRPWMLSGIPGSNINTNPTKYYEEGDPEGIKAKQMYADSLALYHKTQNDIAHFKNKSLPKYESKGGILGNLGEMADKIMYPNGIKPVGQFKSPKSSQCSNDGVCIDVYPKPVQPIEFKKKTLSQPQMDPTQTLGYKMSELTQTPNTYEDRKYLAKIYDFEKKTGRPFTGTPADNVFLYEDLLKEKEKQKEEKRNYDELKHIIDNPLPEPEPRNNNEPEIRLYQEPINMPTIKPGIIPIKPITLPMLNPTPWDPYFVNQSEYQNTIAENTGMEIPNQIKKKPFSFGGAIKSYKVGGTVSGIKKYLYGGEIDNTAMTTDTEMPLSKGAYDVPEPTYNASVVSNESPMQVTDNVTQGTEQLGYKEIVQSFQKKNIDKSLPNWGYAKQEQIKLNELIRKDISAGNAKMDILVEDDIIGDNTLRAMRAYEANGQYTRPEGFKDKWLAEYKKQWEEMQAIGKSKANVPKDNNIIEQPKKAESKTMLDEFYSYFNPSSQKKKDKPFGYGTVLRPEEPKPKVKSMAAKYSAEKYAQKSGGWPKASLLLEGGIEVSTSEMKRKDFDTYFPISGASKPGSKGVRATGRDNNKSFFDAVEKAQSRRKDGTSNNTSLQLIDKLLSSSKKAIVIPKGEDKYGREIKDIYLQDPFYPDKYHALDSLGVVEGEAIFGMDVEPKAGSLTKRQEEITNIARKKGGYKYDQSPYEYRKSKRY